MANNKYENLTYNEKDEQVLKNTELSKEDKETISILKEKCKKRKYCSAIEHIYIFNKNGCPTSRVADIYQVQLRQMQRIFKDLGINRNSYEAQQIAGSTRDSTIILKPHKYAIKDTLLPENLNDFFNYLSVIKGKSKNTVQGYKVDLILFFRYIKQYKGLAAKDVDFYSIDISDIKEDFIKKIKLTDFYAFLSFVENERNNSTYARARKVAALKSFFKYLHTKAKILDENPTSDLEAPKISRRNPVYLTLDESKHLLDSVDENYEHHYRDFCIITIFLNCGLRLSELCSINISSIKGDILTIIGKGNKERTVYLNKASLKAISDYMAERSKMEILDSQKDALFVSERKCRINKSTVERIVKKYIGNAGLDKSKYSPHKLRHTAATLMYKHGKVDIRSLQIILGHENISTTQIYTHVDDEKLREAVSSNPLSDE